MSPIRGGAAAANIDPALTRADQQSTRRAGVNVAQKAVEATAAAGAVRQAAAAETAR
jgi:hypothetical protein